MFAVTLKDIVQNLNLQEVTSFDNLDKIHISVPDCTRPGLQLTGNFDHFGSDRLQFIGNMEYAYLEKLTSEERYKSLDTLFSKDIPALIVTRGLSVFEELIKVSEKYHTPILSTEEVTTYIMTNCIKYLMVELAPLLTMHGVLVDIYGEGVLILGESGVGKSETAMEIVKRGHRLIADDLVEVRRVSNTTLLGRSPEMIRHLIEIRGLGIMDVKELYGVSSVKLQENIHFIIHLELWDKEKVYDRLGLTQKYTEILGISIPSITIPVRPGRNLAIIAEVAAINFRQRQMGYNAAEALTERMFNKDSSK